MAFGLTNSPMTFQKLIDSLFGPECEPYVFAYQDGVIIATEIFEQRLYWLAYMLKKLIEAGLTVNRKKCEFGCSQVRYLSYVLLILRPNGEKIAPIVNYLLLANLKQLRRFLGMIGWYAHFIPDGSDIKVQLLKLTRKGKEWPWAKEQQEVFEKLKEALVTAPVLARPHFSKIFYYSDRR